MKNNKYIKMLFSALIVVVMFAMTACEDEPDKYEVAGGLPSVDYVRLPKIEAADSLITASYMSNTICLVGNNLRSVYELYFNDRKAVLNTSYITDHTLIVNVPRTIPEKVTDKIYMVTRNRDTVSYDFRVIVPAPTIHSMSCEFARAGEHVTLTGDYFLDDPNKPIAVKIGSVAVEQITHVSKTEIGFVMPANVESGFVYVTSIYGTSRSKFRYRDTRNILFDWDGSHGGHEKGHGWQKATKLITDDEHSLDGAYVRFAGELDDTAWKESSFSFNYWPDEDHGYMRLSSREPFAAMIQKYGLEGLQFKFEVNVPKENPWTACAMQVIFTDMETVSYSNLNSKYIADVTVPRGLWIPWKETGSYDTNGQWQTVTMNLKDFTMTHEGNKCDTGFDTSKLCGLTMYVYHGGVPGKPCSPVIMIDNIRVVPIE